MDEMFESEESLSVFNDRDEIKKFIKSTGKVVLKLSKIVWYIIMVQSTRKNFPTLATVSRYVLPVQCSYVASESFFSQAGILWFIRRERLVIIIFVHACYFAVGGHMGNYIEYLIINSIRLTSLSRLITSFIDSVNISVLIGMNCFLTSSQACLSHLF